MPSERSLVFPGDVVAIAEEFVAGPGTYEENGEVHAAWLGEVELDTREFVARVKPRTPTPIMLRPDDVVIGIIHEMRSSMSIVDVVARADALDREIAGDTNGTLHIAKAADHYLERFDDAFRRGDIIKARVLSVDPSLQLTTKGPEFGVVKAYCPRCRRGMDVRGNGLACPECDWKESAKLSADYGTGNV